MNIHSDNLPDFLHENLPDLLLLQELRIRGSRLALTIRPTSPVVGIVTQCCNGVTNEQLFSTFKAITSYKSSGPKHVKSVIGRYKTKLEALKSYKFVKR
jgi:hypothetical protein